MEHPVSAFASGVRELDVTLIRATNYTDDGYPIRTRVGVIRSNTLTQMGALTRDIINYPFFAGVSVNVRLVDEAIQRVPVKEVLKSSKRPGVKSIVMLVGVQTNQFPRAQDIAAWFLSHGIPVLIGGFHVSGMLAMVGLTRDLREALLKGIILVAGEVEGERLPNILADVVQGEAKPLYDLLNPTPDLTNLPIPTLTKGDLQGFASPFGTLDTGRGCPFDCKFCTIINVQGKTVRFRSPERVIEFVRRNYRQTGVRHCFFVDDNLARNPAWRGLFQGLTKLRETEHIPFTFMMQADLAARKMKGGDFFSLAARAGCNQGFFGLETMNQKNLRAEGKLQNHVSEYADLVEHCHSLGITCHAGYIIGLDFDTPDSIREDIGQLKAIGFDSASFYVLTPLPGSEDHQTWWRQRRWMHPDFNMYDSNHVAVMPRNMSAEELQATHRDVWEWFYSTEHMVNVLRGWRANRRQYWKQLSFFAWYLYSSRIERLHPMNCGFWTVRRRNERRPGLSQEAFLPFWLGRARFAGHRLRELVKLYLQLQEVWLQSRPKSRAEERLEELVARTRQGVVDWRQVEVRELQALYLKLKDQMPELKVPSTATLWLKKHNPFVLGSSRVYITQVWRKWYRHAWNPIKWAEVWTFEFVSGLRFITHLLTEGR